VAGKSGNHERETAKFLTKWYSGKTKPYLFWRTPGSGGIGTVSELNLDLYGDIYPLDPDIKKWWPFTIECKTGYDNASLDKHLKYNKSDPIKAFWIQVNDDAKKAKKYPLLIYQKLGLTPQWVGINYFILQTFAIELTDLRCVSLKWSVEDSLHEMHFFSLNEFFDRISPTIMKERIGKC